MITAKKQTTIARFTSDVEDSDLVLEIGRDRDGDLFVSINTGSDYFATYERADELIALMRHAVAEADKTRALGFRR